jgi:ATP-dependent protease ClpP protease subunit
VGFTLATLLAPFVRADHIVLQNGRAFDGEFVAETNSTVTLEMFFPPSYTMERRFNKAQIKTWQRPAHVGAPYVMIPIIGEIGNDVTVDAIRAGLEKARAARPRYIVLAIDSPGGDIGQMDGIVDLLIGASKEVKIVAYVKQAYSAAAVIAMCCNEIYAKPDAAIGACVPFRLAENGPEDVDAKFRSAFEAKIRASTAQGGHADLLIRGMSELDLQIYLATEDSKPVLRTSGPGKLIKGSGQILTLTADEAVQCGLARIAPDMADLGNQVAGGAWYESSRRPWNAVVATIALQRRRLAREAAIARVRPEYNAIERRIAPLVAKGVAANNAINNLTAQCNAELQQVDHEYRQAFLLTQYQSDPAAAAARALEVHNASAAAARQNWQSNVAGLQAVADAAWGEVAQLRQREKQLLDSIPD